YGKARIRPDRPADASGHLAALGHCGAWGAGCGAVTVARATPARTAVASQTGRVGAGGGWPVGPAAYRVAGVSASGGHRLVMATGAVAWPARTKGHGQRREQDHAGRGGDRVSRLPYHRID